MVSESAILYQNALGTVTLIDIPTSLALAQSWGSDCPCNTREIYSTPPVQTPYPSTEPKSDGAKDRVMQRNHTGSSEGFPTGLLVEALEEIAAAAAAAVVHEQNRWCHERKTRSSVPIGKAVVEADMEKSAEQGTTVTATESALDESPREPVLTWDQAEGWQALEPVFLSVSPPAPLLSRSIVNRLIYNPSPRCISILLDDDSKHYFLPPKSSFILSKISASSTPVLSMAAYSQFHDSTASAGPGKFDFILLDPPWSNRSVRRSKVYKMELDPMEAIRPVLGQHIAPNGLVACWVTNKLNAREIATEAFEAWDVEIIEEWAWLKVTSNGEPVTEIEGLWRKPYEILLIGRKRHNETVVDGTPKWAKQFRIIVAVPDIHSRKPHLKELIEPMMTNPKGYRALEMFGRNLTAGWWTWGDEVLRFNWSGWWTHQGSCRGRNSEPS